MKQDDIWSLYIERKLDDFKDNIYNFYNSDKEEPDNNWDKIIKRLNDRGKKDK